MNQLPGEVALPVEALRSPTGRADRVRRAVVPLATVALAVGAVAIFDPVHRDIPLCPLHSLTGIWCPFCGGLRSTYLLVHGHVAAAASANLVLLLAIPWLMWRWLDGWRGRPARPLPGPSWWPAVAVMTFLAAFTVLRNLPVGSFLAPS